jgi:hypothetical protein
MWVAELQCDHGHGFEGWFASREDFEQQQSRSLVQCPTCGSSHVTKRLSAPRLNLGAAAPAEAPVTSQNSADPADLLRAIVAHVKAHTEDVGTRFAQEARRIHAHEAPDRAIRGRASAAELESLHEEGIDVWAMPGVELEMPTH